MYCKYKNNIKFEIQYHELNQTKKKNITKSSNKKSTTKLNFICKCHEKLNEGLFTHIDVSPLSSIYKIKFDQETTLTHTHTLTHSLSL